MRLEHLDLSHGGRSGVDISCGDSPLGIAPAGGKYRRLSVVEIDAWPVGSCDCFVRRFLRAGSKHETGYKEKSAARKLSAEGALLAKSCTFSPDLHSLVCIVG
jgi:hypothetical protein